MNKKVLIVTIVLSVIALLIGIFSAIVLTKDFSIKTNTLPELPVVSETQEDKITVSEKNILLIGTDKSEELSDVLIICRYNPYTNKISLLSIPRDTRVYYKNDYYKINSLYQFGIDTLTNKIENITDLRIDNYIVFSTNSFKNVIDILGGVDFNVPQNMKYSDPVQNLYINLKKGYQHLDGEQAEQLVRFRKYTTGDLQRVQVQQDFIKALIEQKLTPGIITKAPALTKELLDNVKTDLTFNDLKPYLSNLDNITEVKIETYTLPGVGDYVGNVSYFLQDTEKTPSVVDEFLNGKNDFVSIEEVDENSTNTFKIEEIAE